MTKSSLFSDDSGFLDVTFEYWKCPSGNVAAQGMVQQVAKRWSTGRMEEGPRKDVPPCSLSHKWRQLPAQHHCQPPLLHIPQRASCGTVPLSQAKFFPCYTLSLISTKCSNLFPFLGHKKKIIFLNNLVNFLAGTGSIQAWWWGTSKRIPR